MICKWYKVTNKILKFKIISILFLVLAFIIFVFEFKGSSLDMSRTK